MSLVHGGDVQGFVDEYGYEPLDFSANVSPLGLPPEVSQAIIDCIPRLAAYPDPLCRRLTSALAAHHGVSEDSIICGNGCSDLIFRLAQVLRARRILVCAPTFAEYATAFGQTQTEVDEYVLSAEDDYVVGEDILDAIQPCHQAVFICQPNNPTGRTANRDLCRHILEKCSSCGARLVVDECFIEFIDNPGDITMECFLSDEHLIILKAFTKLYGMAGLRLGYLLCSDNELACRLREAAQPWAVSTVAQAAGLAALSSEGYVEQLRNLIKDERTYLKDALAALGIKAEGEANFLFFELNGDAEFCQRMRRQGVLVRDCSNYSNLKPGCYRVAVRSHGENKKLVQAIAKVLEEHS